MFLAINEILHSKLRYSLIVGVLFLIAYLVFFLNGLSYGLVEANRTAIDKWKADQIILSEDANDSLMASVIPLEEFDHIQATEKAALVQFPAVIIREKHDEEKINAIFLGVKDNQFLMPNIVEGTAFGNEQEAVVNDSLKEQYGILLGDEIEIAGSDKKLKITGFTNDATYNAAPVIYVDLAMAQGYRFGFTGDLAAESEMEKPVSAAVIRGKVDQLPEGLQKNSIEEFVQELPGYQAQVLTFGFMIGFLILISAIVVGIFIYVLTLQKISIFGILKAQGVSSRFISNSVIIQTFILALIGTLIGLAATLLTAFLLPNKVPFAIDWPMMLGTAVLMIFFAVTGALFSVRTIVKIDPIKAIG